MREWPAGSWILQNFINIPRGSTPGHKLKFSKVPSWSFGQNVKRAWNGHWWQKLVSRLQSFLCLSQKFHPHWEQGLQGTRRLGLKTTWIIAKKKLNNNILLPNELLVLNGNDLDKGHCFLFFYSPGISKHTLAEWVSDSPIQTFDQSDVWTKTQFFWCSVCPSVAFDQSLCAAVKPSQNLTGHFFKPHLISA